MPDPEPTPLSHREVQESVVSEKDGGSALQVGSEHVNLLSVTDYRQEFIKFLVDTLGFRQRKVDELVA